MLKKLKKLCFHKTQKEIFKNTAFSAKSANTFKAIFNVFADNNVNIANTFYNENTIKTLFSLLSVNNVFIVNNAFTLNNVNALYTAKNEKAVYNDNKLKA